MRGSRVNYAKGEALKLTIRLYGGDKQRIAEYAKRNGVSQTDAYQWLLYERALRPYNMTTRGMT